MALPVLHVSISVSEEIKMQHNMWTRSFSRARLRRGSVQTPIRIRYRGGHTRNYPKKSYEMIIRGRTAHFNAEYDDPSLIRNALSFKFLEKIGLPSPKTRHYRIIWNGADKGVYLRLEAVKRRFFRIRGISCKSLMYASNDSANFSLICPDTGERKRSLFEGYTRVIGTARDEEKLKSFIWHLNTLEGAELYRYLNRRLDIGNYLRWLAGAVLTNNYDGFDQNYAIYEHRKSGKYRMIPWDYEGTWGRNCYGRRCSSEMVRIEGYNSLTEKLLRFPEVRSRYKKLLRRLLDRKFTVNYVMPIVNSLYRRISDDVAKDSTRPHDLSDFRAEPDVIRTFIRERRAFLLRELERMS
ncbi:CotH kinase family protein [Paenibacillus thermoaerophilus]|uniref:CotH kinase family protein n=1 Tax=Paenibacillus thermoaerophilus TaxID=1215385 RepID=A0ABW2V7B1_9BACL|nr:CotH kinase family protein [Paenibacillus thermoaerophilus]TMV16141.1 spore coat protein CotH [Paenibacillus thermoaerophilus]